jgi:hypothetical protein
MKLQFNHLKTYAAIKAFLRQKKYPPTQRDLMELTGVQSQGTICRHLTILEAEGCIRRSKNETRAIVLTGIEPDPRKEEEPVLIVKLNRRQLFTKSAHRRGPKAAALPKYTKAQLNARVAMVVEKALSDPQGTLSEYATLKVLANGIKVIVRKPSLWGSKAHS